MGELWNLPEPHTPLEVGLPKSKCSHMLCLPLPCTQMLGMQTPFFSPLAAFRERGVWGFAPWLPIALDLAALKCWECKCLSSRLSPLS